jgi:uncharacterized lipoprotein YmbA
VLPGCALYPPAEPSRFYLLTPVEAGQGQPARPLDSEPWIGVGPLVLPRYLDRPQIVTRDGEHRLRLAELDQWASPLQDNVIQVLADNLMRLIGSRRVVIYPWRGSLPVRYQVDVRIVRLDARYPQPSGEGRGDAVLAARWMVLDLTTGRVLANRSSDIRIPLATAVLGRELDGLAEAYSQALGRLSAEIARVLAGLPG